MFARKKEKGYFIRIAYYLLVTCSRRWIIINFRKAQRICSKVCKYGI